MQKPSKRPLIIAFPISSFGWFPTVFPISSFGWFPIKLWFPNWWSWPKWRLEGLPLFHSSNMFLDLLCASASIHAAMQMSMQPWVDFQLRQLCDPASLCPTNTCDRTSVSMGKKWLRVPLSSASCFGTTKPNYGTTALLYCLFWRASGAGSGAPSHGKSEDSEHLAQFFKTNWSWSLCGNVS